MKMKHASAITTALIISVVVGLGIVVIGVSAFTNHNTVPLQNSPSSGLISNNSSNINSTQNTAVDPSQAQQLQQEVTTLQSQLQQASQTIQQYQNLLLVLQQRGVIRIGDDGNIYIPQGSSSSFH
jgi:predicted Rossmann fold nucleotide-binding protein DprA/Smf involved in DNA uptake